MRSIVLAFTISTFILFVSACSNTSTLQDSWHADNFKPDDFNEVLVVGTSTNISSRLIWEAAFVQKLKEYDIKAIESNHVIGTGKVSKEKIAEYLKAHPVKYLLISQVEGITQNKNYEQDEKPIEGSDGYYLPDNYDRKLVWSSSMADEEGHVESYETMLMETLIFHNGSGKLMWAAKTESFKPESVSETAQSIANLVIMHLHDE